MRRTGVLLNISSLPNRQGIGGFGREFYDFVDFLKTCHCSLWQILPLTSIGQGNSPYSSVSAFAGNYLYIDANFLYEDGLIDNKTMNDAIYNDSPYTVNYKFASVSKRALIKAVARFDAFNHSDLSSFCTVNEHWLDDYASFQTIKEFNGNRPWWEWKTCLRDRKEFAIKEIVSANKEIYDYYVLEQYLFHKQWQNAKLYANSQGICIVGDMPIYVSLDSADVWSHPSLFQLDIKGSPIKVAGVPPDYFATHGQLWGNPLYNYNTMKKNNFKWFVERMQRMLNLYDICRFDHFRAIAEYWAVPADAIDASRGEWLKGGGIAMMRAILDSVDGEIIAEDLGIIDDKVTALRDKCNLKGMRVMQFGFDGDDSTHTPHNYTQNSVAYTGTHDNNTLFGWLYELPLTNKNILSSYIGVDGELVGGSGSQHVWGCIRTLLTSVADYAVIPFQDLLGWGADTRMNIPGVPKNNWRMRISADNIAQVDSKRLANLINISKRH